MNMKIQFLYALVLATGLMHGVHSAVFTITNNCPFKITPATLTNDARVPTRYELASHASNTINIPAPWSGRIWAQFSGGATKPATLVEITLSGSNGKDTYDISLVDGFNLPVKVVPQGGSCPVISCPVDINSRCLANLAVKDGSGGTIGCKSACEAFNKPEYCCTGDYEPRGRCPPTDYSRFFKNLCPQAYSYAHDDPSSTFTCNTGPNYAITFCP